MHCEGRYGLERGLVGWWRLMDSNQGAQDLIGANNGTRNGGVGYSTDGERGFLACDGIDDYVSIASADFSIGNAWTLAVWHKQDSADANIGIIQVGNNLATPDANNFKINSSYVLVSSSAGVVAKYYTDIPLTTDWAHTAVTWNGASLLVYRDGVNITPSLTKVIDGALTMTNTNRPVYIGADVNTTPVTFWNGLIADARPYNRALSAAEIARLARIY